MPTNGPYPKGELLLSQENVYWALFSLPDPPSPGFNIWHLFWIYCPQPLSTFQSVLQTIGQNNSEKLIFLRIARAPSCLQIKSFPCWAATSQPLSATPAVVQPALALSVPGHSVHFRTCYSSLPVPLPVVPLSYLLSPAGNGCPAKPGSMSLLLHQLPDPKQNSLLHSPGPARRLMHRYIKLLSIDVVPFCVQRDPVSH